MSLSSRQRVIAELVSRGHSDKTIAAELGIQYATVIGGLME